jgi:hypothetical protein
VSLLNFTAETSVALIEPFARRSLRKFAPKTTFLNLCVDRVREKTFHEKTGFGMFGDDRDKRASLAANAEPALSSFPTFAEPSMAAQSRGESLVNSTALSRRVCFAKEEARWSVATVAIARSATWAATKTAAIWSIGCLLEMVANVDGLKPSSLLRRRKRCGFCRSRSRQVGPNSRYARFSRFATGWVRRSGARFVGRRRRGRCKAECFVAGSSALISMIRRNGLKSG